MPGFEQSTSPTPPPWNESDSFRETTLQLLDDPEDRDAMRRAGRVLYDLAVAETMKNGATEDDPSITRAEFRAVAADLRHTQGYLEHVAQSAENSDLEPAEDQLARYAGKLARRVGKVVRKIERRLS